jgi:hypothetical protein
MTGSAINSPPLRPSGQLNHWGKYSATELYVSKKSGGARIRLPDAGNLAVEGEDGLLLLDRQGTEIGGVSSGESCSAGFGRGEDRDGPLTPALSRLEREIDLDEAGELAGVALDDLTSAHEGTDDGKITNDSKL